MAKFETKGQIVSLFLGAACVGVLLIVLLTAEANKRMEVMNRKEEVVTETDDITELSGLKYLWSKLKYSLRSFSKSDETLKSQDETKGRRKREASEDYYSSHVIEGEYDDVISDDTSKVIKTTELKNISEHVDDNLGAALLSTALGGHKIRHLEEKVKMLGEKSQLVKVVKKIYCAREESVLYVLCKHSGTSDVDEESTTTTSTNSTSKEALDSSKENSTAHDMKNFTGNIQSYVEVMTNRLQPPEASHTISSAGICSSYTEVIVVIVITTFVNFFSFVLLSLFCRLQLTRKSRQTRSPVIKNGRQLLTNEDDDDLDDYDDEFEPPVQIEGKRSLGNLHVNLVHQARNLKGLDEI